MAFKLTFGEIKHSYNARPLSAVLSRQPNATGPVALLSKYLTLRGLRPGTFFFQRMDCMFQDQFSPTSL